MLWDYFFSCTPVLVLTTSFQLTFIFHRKSVKWYTVLVLRIRKKNEKAESHFQNRARQKQKKLHPYSTDRFSAMSQQKLQLLIPRSRRLISNEVNSVSCKNFAHLQHCFTFQSSQEFLPEPASKLLHLLILKRKSLSTWIIYVYNLLYSSLLQSWLYAVEGASRKENNVSCSSELALHTAFLAEILRIPSWCARTSCLFLRSLVSHPRQKRRSQTRSTRQILWDWGLIPPCFLWSV